MKIKDILSQSIIKNDEIKPPYIIAEAGVNHEGSMDIAKRLIDEAAEGGAHAIKFQTYKADTIASKNSPAYWDITKEPTDSQYKLFQKYDKFWKNEFEQLKMYCDKVGIEFLSTPFDIESAKFLNEMVDVFKIYVFPQFKKFLFNKVNYFKFYTKCVGINFNCFTIF